MLGKKNSFIYITNSSAPNADLVFRPVASINSYTALLNASALSYFIRVASLVMRGLQK